MIKYYNYLGLLKCRVGRYIPTLLLECVSNILFVCSILGLFAWFQALPQGFGEISTSIHSIQIWEAQRLA